MTLGIIKRTTPNFSFRIPFFDGPNWGRELERNFDTIDAVLFAATGFTNVKGVWTNDTEYVAGDRVVDPADGTTWQASVTHTSAATGSFEDDRTAHPTYWVQLSSTVGFRGQWTTATNYNVNEFLYDDHRYGAVISKYTSGASYNADVAAGKILTLIDLKAPYDQTVANAAAAAASATAADASADAALISETNADASEAAALASKNAAAVSETNAATSASNALTSQNAAAQSALDAASFGIITSLFNFSTTVSYPPAAGQVRLNNAAQNSATRLDFNHVNAGGVDLTHIMPDLVQAGTIIILQDKATIGNWKSYTATGPATLSGSDFQIPVVFRSGGSDIANNRPTQIAFAGGGGSASVTTDDNPPAGPLRDGQLWFKSSTGVFYVYYDDGNTSQWVQVSAAPQIAPVNTRNRGHIDPGFNLANDTTDANNDIVFPAGVVASEISPYPLMNHAAQTIRQTDVNFDVNNTDRLGGKFTSAAIPNGPVHCFVISNGTLVKSGFSPNVNPTSDDLYPAGYTHYRRVASWKKEGGALIGIKQDGDHFLRTSSIATDRNSVSTTAGALMTTNGPTGIVTQPLLAVAISVAASSDAYIQLASADQGVGMFATICRAASDAGGANRDGTYLDGGLYTNTAAQIYFAQVAAAGTITGGTVFNYGWIDKRGRQ